MMQLLDLSPEVAELVVRASFRARKFRRGMRLRLVSRFFRNAVDNAILIDRVLDVKVSPLSLHPSRFNAYKPWDAYVKRYLADRIFQGPSWDPTHEEYQMWRVARRVSELTGGADEAATRQLIGSLVGLWCHYGRSAMLLKPKSRSRNPYCEVKIDLLALDAAIYLGNVDVVRRLLTDGPGEQVVVLAMDPRGPSNPGSLERRQDLAANFGNVETLKLLMEMDADMKRVMAGDRFQPLVAGNMIRWAATAGNHDVFNYVLDIQGPYDGSYSERRQPLSSALQDAIMDTPFPEDYERGASIYYFQVSGLQSPIARSRPGDPHHLEGSEERLIHSARLDRLQMVRHFLRRGGTVDSQGKMHHPFLDITPFGGPFAIAIEVARNIEMVRVMLDAGADPNGYRANEAPLLAAVAHVNLALVRLLLERGADVNFGVPPPVVAAVATENEELVRLLLRAGAVLDSSPEVGGRAMSLARTYGLESMKALLAREGVVVDRVARYEPAPRNGPERKGAAQRYTFRETDNEVWKRPRRVPKEP